MIKMVVIMMIYIVIIKMKRCHIDLKKDKKRIREYDKDNHVDDDDLYIGEYENGITVVYLNQQRENLIWPMNFRIILFHNLLYSQAGTVYHHTLQACSTAAPLEVR